MRSLGARRFGEPIEIIEYAIRYPGAESERILQPLTGSTELLSDWSPADRAYAIWHLILEGVRHPRVSGLAGSRQCHVLQAAFRLPDGDVDGEWGGSLTDRFKQLRALRSVFGEATSNQPMEIAWKHGVERLAEYLDSRLSELETATEWAPYRRPEPRSAPSTPSGRAPTRFRKPSEGAQKLIVNLYNLTVIMKGRQPSRRIAERMITSQDDGGLEYYTSHAWTSGTLMSGRSYVPTRAVWGCRAEQIDENGLTLTRLCFPKPLKTDERAFFVAEMVYETTPENDLEIDQAWCNVDVDVYGIDPGELRDEVLPVSGLTIRIRFDDDDLPQAAWWYAEQNELERYDVPPAESPHRLEIVGGGVAWTFERPCEPRENYGIAYRW